ncbi:hypothetical protein NL676_015131 [Syzygium grande]|nr:hypothetical protein NL676_015131 [Syzygium grande]
MLDVVVIGALMVRSGMRGTRNRKYGKEGWVHLIILSAVAEEQTSTFLFLTPPFCLSFILVSGTIITRIFNLVRPQCAPPRPAPIQKPRKRVNGSPASRTRQNRVPPPVEIPRRRRESRGSPARSNRSVETPRVPWSREQVIAAPRDPSPRHRIARRERRPRYSCGGAHDPRS